MSISINRKKDAEPGQVSRVLNKLFSRYTSSENFVSKMSDRFPDERRSLLLHIKCKARSVLFGAKIEGGKIYRFTKEEYDNYPDDLVHSTMNSKHFVQILTQQDDYGAYYDVNYAWAAGHMRFEGGGNQTIVHRSILCNMFVEFCELLKI